MTTTTTVKEKKSNNDHDNDDDNILTEFSANKASHQSGYGGNLGRRPWFGSRETSQAYITLTYAITVVTET